MKIFLVGFGMLCSTALAGETIARFESREYLNRDWPRTLLNYDIDLKPGSLNAGKAQVVDSLGQPVESQIVAMETHPDGSIKKARVSFYAELPKGKTFAYALESNEQPKIFESRVKVDAKGDAIELISPEAGVRVAAPGEKTFAQPVDPKDVPAPILGYRLNTGQWAGKGWLESDRKVVAWSQKVVADGPLYKEYAYEVTFTPKGVYKVRVRVEAELPLVQIAEEFDFGAATAGRDFFVLSLSSGWTPDTAMFAGGSAPDPKRVSVRGRRVEHDSEVWRQPLDFTQDLNHAGFFPSIVWGSPSAQWYCLFSDAGDARTPGVAVMSEHAGAWRLPDQSLSAFQWTKDGDVQARFRIAINLNGCPQNPFSTAEIDPSLPQTLGRRMWSLVLGSRPMAETIKTIKDGKEAEMENPLCSVMDFYRNYQGYITLDDYKNWTLSWPEEELSRPRVMATPESLARLKANFERCPGKELIKDTYLISGDAQNAVREANRACAALTDGRFDDMLSYFQSHYRQTQGDYEAVFLSDSALACKELPADLRQQLRAKIAAMCYILSHPDFNPRGAGVHLGNPNMAINRYMSLPLYAVLIQDHPIAKTWIDDAVVYTKWKAASSVTSGGGTFRECPGYATYGPTTFLTTAAIALRNIGCDVDRDSLKAFGQYFTDIETPISAPRGIVREDFLASLGGRKVRSLPAFGNGSDRAGGQSQMLLASLCAKSDPEFAANMMGGWLDGGAFFGTEMVHPQFWFYWDPDIQPVTPKHEDRMIAGFGGVLRAHANTPDETYVGLRNGYMQSHWNPDQGTFVLYSRGVCLAPPTGFGYSAAAGVCHDSRICFGEPLADHEHGRVDTNIDDYSSTPSVGYLLGRQTFVKRWDKSKQLTNDFDWSRQVVLLRSTHPDGANYVVVRDSTQGECPLPNWWYQWLVAKAENVKPTGDGVHVEASDGVKLDVAFVEPANPKIEITPVKVAGFAEDYAQLKVAQAPGGGYLTVFYPSKGSEAGLGKVERLADGLVKVTTPESEDYVFAAVDKPVVFKNDLVDINCFAGAIRVFKDKVLIVNASGQMGKVGYKGSAAEGIGPFERAVPLSPEKAETLQAGRSIATLSPPQGDGKLIALDGVDGIKGWVLVQEDKVTYVAAEGFGKIAYKDFYIKGEAPFVCVYQPGKVTLTAEGRRRIFQMPIPGDIVPSNLIPPTDNLPADFINGWKVAGYLNWPWAISATVDGIATQPGWYDGKMTIGLDEGKHVATLTPYTNPPVWPVNAYTQLLPVN